MMNRVGPPSRLAITAVTLVILLMTSGCSSSGGSSTGGGRGNDAKTGSTGGPEASAGSTDRDSSSAPRESDTMKDAFEGLLSRPSIAQIDADYESIFQTIRERLVAEVGVALWVPGREPIRGSACGEGLSNLDDAETHSYDAGVSPGNIPDDRWDTAVAIVTEVAGAHGFGEPKVVIDGPGSHEVSLRDRFDGELLFGTGANTILGAFSACHLSEEAHRRGTYEPPKY